MITKCSRSQSIFSLKNGLSGFVFCLAACFCSIPCTAHSGASQSDASAKSSSDAIFRLNASITELGKYGQTDAPYRYLTEQGVGAYLKKDYVVAETLLKGALEDGKEERVSRKNMAILLTNLAGVYRDEHKLQQAGILFGQAVTIRETRPNGTNLPLPYVLKQYAGYLRKVGREQDAKLAELTAAEDFKPAPRLSTKATDDAFKEIATKNIPAAQSPVVQNEPVQATETSKGPSHAETPQIVEPQPAAPKIIFIRLTMYSALIGQENAWEALWAANDILSTGNNVTLLLDKEGVRLCNVHNIDSYQYHRQSTEKLIATQDLLHKFMQGGGKVIASDRWIKTFGLNAQEIPQGVILLSDRQMNEVLIDNTGSIVNY